MEQVVRPIDKYEIDAVDRLLIAQIIKYPKTSEKELMALANISRNALGYRKRKPAFKAALNELMGTTQEHLEEAARRAARRLKKLVDHEDPKTAEPFIKMALSNHLSQKMDLNIQPTVTYKTTVQADGSLIQEVLGSGVKKNEQE